MRGRIHLLLVSGLRMRLRLPLRQLPGSAGEAQIAAWGGCPMLLDCR